jgi:glucose-1-phosphate cytidylyltransferase
MILRSYGQAGSLAVETVLNIADVPVFILCGGLGTRLREMTEFRPKPMVPIGRDPILLHIMKYYGSFGFNQFVLCMGYKSEILREYFLNFYAMNSDATFELKTNAVSRARMPFAV